MNLSCFEYGVVCRSSNDSAMKRILLVIDHLGTGGAQRQIVGLANGLVELGYQIDLFVYYPEIAHHLKKLDSGVNLLTSIKTDRLGLNVVWQLRKHIINNGYHSAMAFLNTPAVYLEIANFMARKDTAIYYSERSSFALVGNSTLNTLRYKLHKSCSGLSSNSVLQTKRLEKLFESKDVRFIPNAMPAEFFQEKDFSAVWKTKNIAVVSHTKPFKNYRYIAQSLIAYLQCFGEKPPVIDWYGEVYSFDDVIDEIATVKSMLKSAGLSNHLVFRGVIEDVPEILSETYLLLHPSMFESSSNSIAEAMASSTPVICGDIADHSWLADRVKGISVVELNDPMMLANQLRRFLLMELSEYRNLGESVQTFAERNYSSRSVIEKYESFLLGDKE